MDREERRYQKAMMICVQGIGASLNKATEALDVVDGLGQSHHESLREAKWELWGKGSLMKIYPKYTALGLSNSADTEPPKCSRVLSER